MERRREQSGEERTGNKVGIKGRGVERKQWRGGMWGGESGEQREERGSGREERRREEEMRGEEERGERREELRHITRHRGIIK